jgi:hypothetical protein
VGAAFYALSSSFGVRLRERFFPRVCLPVHDEQNVFTDPDRIGLLAGSRIRLPMLHGAFYPQRCRAS